MLTKYFSNQNRYVFNFLYENILHCTSTCKFFFSVLHMLKLYYYYLISERKPYGIVLSLLRSSNTSLHTYTIYTRLPRLPPTAQMYIIIIRSDPGRSINLLRRAVYRVISISPRVLLLRRNKRLFFTFSFSPKQLYT